MFCHQRLGGSCSACISIESDKSGIGFWYMVSITKPLTGYPGRSTMPLWGFHEVTHWVGLYSTLLNPTRTKLKRKVVAPLETEP